MSRCFLYLLGATCAVLLAHPAVTSGSIVTYDFPGTPGSGLVVDQTQTFPGNSTWGDFSRTNVTAGTASGVFDSTFWNTTATFDPTQYEGFSITAAAGYHLDLAGVLTFDQTRTAGGPTKGRVQIFLNGSATAYSTFDFNPGSSWTSETFNFTPTVDADNITSAEFRFYGWNGGTPSASMLLDNVSLNLSIVPESSNIWAGVFGLSIAATSTAARARKRRRVLK